MHRTRSLRSAALVVAAAAILAITANSLSFAAGGPSVLLGKSNSSGTTTKISAKHGPALSLKSKAKSPSLAVSSKKLVKNLNADMVGGAHLSQISPTTYRDTLDLAVGQDSVASGTEAYLSTTRLPAGTYVARMTGMMEPDTGGSYSCLAVDYNKLVVSDLHGYYLYQFTDDSSSRLDITQENIVRVTRGHQVIYGCSFSNAATTVVIPPTFSFQKLTAAKPIPGTSVFTPRAGHRLSGILD